MVWSKAVTTNEMPRFLSGNSGKKLHPTRKQVDDKKIIARNRFKNTILEQKLISVCSRMFKWL